MLGSNYPYIRRKDLEEELGLSRTTVYERCKEIEDLRDRYGDYAVIHDGNITLVNILAFIDYLRFRSYLQGKNTKKFVPEYDPEKIAKQMGMQRGGKVCAFG